jgi:hypothetical protein
MISSAMWLSYQERIYQDMMSEWVCYLSLTTTNGILRRYGPGLPLPLQDTFPSAKASGHYRPDAPHTDDVQGSRSKCF